MSNSSTQHPVDDKPPSLMTAISVTARMLRWGYRTTPYGLPALLIMVVLVGLAPFGVSYFDSRVIDELIHLVGMAESQRQTDTLLMLIGIVVGIQVLERALWIGVTYTEKIVYFNLSRDISMTFLRKASELDMMHYENAESHNLIQKAKETYTTKPATYMTRVMWMSADLIRVLSSIGIILSFSLPAFILVVCTTLPGLLVSAKLGQGTWSIWGANATDRRRFMLSSELLMKERALMELRIFNSKEHLLDTVQNIYDNFTGKERKNQLRRALIDTFTGSLSTFGTMAFWITAIMAALNGDISLGLFTFYVASLSRFSGSLNNLFRNLSTHYEDSLYMNDLFRFFALENQIVPGSKVLPYTGKPPRIEFKDVSFAYPGTKRLVLKNFNLTIEPGQHVALIGVNGAGKSTLIKLLTRFYDVTGGQLLVDGIDIRELDTESYYRYLGIMFQDFVRYSQFDVRTNIELGNPERSGDENHLQNAIFKGDAGRFIEAFDNKLGQVLDKSFNGGISPSDGQWQRIALARAFFRDAPVLLLDEPTSAIDAKAEAEIFERLYEFSQEKTLIIVSHRFSTVRAAHKICILDGGQIVESGTHEELMALNGRYKEAFEAQAKGYQEEARVGGTLKLAPAFAQK